MHHRMPPSKTGWPSLNVVIFPPFFVLVGLRTYQHPGNRAEHDGLYFAYTLYYLFCCEYQSKQLLFPQTVLTDWSLKWRCCVFLWGRNSSFKNVYKNFVLQRLNSLWLSVDFCPVASRRRLTLTSSRQNVGQTADLFHTIFELNRPPQPVWTVCHVFRELL
jgi:hypothetical protein